MPSRSRYQRRHYTQLASILADLRLDALDRGDMFQLQTVETFRDRLSDIFRRDNPRFSLARFRAACDGDR